MECPDHDRDFCTCLKAARAADLKARASKKRKTRMGRCSDRRTADLGEGLVVHIVPNGTRMGNKSAISLCVTKPKPTGMGWRPVGKPVTCKRCAEEIHLYKQDQKTL